MVSVQFSCRYKYQKYRREEKKPPFSIDFLICIFDEVSIL